MSKRKQTRERIAYHESAHFVVAYAMSGYGESYGLTVARISIEPSHGNLGAVTGETYTSFARPLEDGFSEYPQDVVRNDAGILSAVHAVSAHATADRSRRLEIEPRSSEGESASE